MKRGSRRIENRMTSIRNAVCNHLDRQAKEKLIEDQLYPSGT